MRVAVIGAGLAGLAAAEALQGDGHDVVVLEKSRGAGGRTATRRADELRFDHGAPYLHAACARSAASPPSTAARCDRSATERCTPPSARPPRTPSPKPSPSRSRCARACTSAASSPPAPPGGSSTSTPLRSASTTRYSSRAGAAGRRAAPRGRAALAARCDDVVFAACWSVMAAWSSPLQLEVDLCATRTVSPCRRRIRQARPAGARGLGAPSRPRTLRDAPGGRGRRGDRAPARPVRAGRGQPLPEPEHAAAHRWRYARPLAPLAERTLAEGTLAIAGDWCGGSTAGDALRSGRAAAAALRHAAATPA